MQDLIPMMIVQYVLLIGGIPLARRVSPSRPWAWIVAILIPAVGWFALMALIVKAFAVILERIDLMCEKSAARRS
jgi:hypothetical protein